MVAPFQIAFEFNSKVWIVIHRLKYMAVQWILLVQLLTSLGDTEGVAFMRIELHLPSLGPVLEWSEVSLELYLILDLYLLVTIWYAHSINLRISILMVEIWPNGSALHKEATKSLNKAYDKYLNEFIGNSLQTNPNTFYSFMSLSKTESRSIPSLLLSTNTVYTDQSKSSLLTIGSNIHSPKNPFHSQAKVHSPFPHQWPNNNYNVHRHTT